MSLVFLGLNGRTRGSYLCFKGKSEAAFRYKK